EAMRAPSTLEPDRSASSKLLIGSAPRRSRAFEQMETAVAFAMRSSPQCKAGATRAPAGTAVQATGHAHACRQSQTKAMRRAIFCDEPTAAPAMVEVTVLVASVTS